jgi:hypothetical protein
VVQGKAAPESTDDLRADAPAVAESEGAAVTKEQLHILQHSLGVDEHGCGNQYRNHYVAEPFAAMDELVDAGFMRDCGAGNPGFIGEWMHTYQVTEAGKLAMIENSPPPPRLTRSQNRYREYLREDSGMRFGEWLRRQKPRRAEGFSAT